LLVEILPEIALQTKTGHLILEIEFLNKNNISKIETRILEVIIARVNYLKGKSPACI
jgi:hypothetical protein